MFAESNSSLKRNSLNTAGLLTAMRIYLALHVTKLLGQISIWRITWQTNTHFFSGASSNNYKKIKQNYNDCIYMTPLNCVFTLSLFWWPEPLKYINGWVFLLKGLGLQRTTLWASGSFWRRSQLLLINWRAPVTGTIFLSISAQGAADHRQRYI